MKTVTTANSHCAPAVLTTFDASVKRALSSQSTLIDRGEHCSLDPERLAAIGRVPGSQIRIVRGPDQYAIYTVSETRQETADNIVRMALAARQRLGTADEFDATIETQVLRSELTDEAAEATSEFVERLDDSFGQQAMVAIAPHGGAIERHTDEQAERVAAVLGGDRVSTWRCKGFKAGGGAFERWHITSGDIHEASFPLLNTIIARGFAYAVAFHGFSEDDVLIGGGAPLGLKQEVAKAVLKALAGSQIQVRVAAASENYDGDNPNNIVNRLTAGGTGGVQIEQSIEARDRFGLAIADAVAAVYRAKLARVVC
jgi:phage replication-related protein YjqB (UPF0714/DUF867 family)